MAKTSRRSKIKLRLDHWCVFFILIALGNLTNGIWMLIGPASWYANLPASVPDFGSLNEHFIRDLGCMFCTWGALALWAAITPARRKVVIIALSLWYGLHALLHAWDTWRGFVGREHWRIDLPLTYAPAILLLSILFFSRLGRDEA